MRGSSRRLPTAPCCLDSASARTSLPNGLAFRASRGFEVTQLDPGRIRQLYEVRGAIDALAARLAAGRAGSDAAGRAQFEAALCAGRAIDRKTPLARLI